MEVTRSRAQPGGDGLYFRPTKPKTNQVCVCLCMFTFSSFRLARHCRFELGELCYVLPNGAFPTKKRESRVVGVLVQRLKGTSSALFINRSGYNHALVRNMLHSAKRNGLLDLVWPTIPYDLRKLEEDHRQRQLSATRRWFHFYAHTRL